MKITVLIADDIKETRENIKTLLSFDERIEIIGEAENGEEAIKAALDLYPNIILMDINMPVLDGLKATEEICITNPNTSVIIMSVQGEREYLKKAMSFGAREYIIKPFSNDDLINTIIRVYEMEEKKKLFLQNKDPIDENIEKSQVISIFSPKGGVGKTTLAVNLAIGIAKNSNKKVAIVDLDLQFGDIALMLNIQPKKTIYHLVQDINSINDESIEDYLITHFSGLRALCAPSKPEYAEYITAQHIEKILGILRNNYNYIIIDSTQNFSDIVLTTLDISDDIFLVSTTDLPTIKNIKLGLDLMYSLNYSKDKIKMVLNKASEQYGIKYKDIENTLNMKIDACIPEDNATVIPYANKGFPFILARSEKRISRVINELASLILGQDIDKDSEKKGVFNIFPIF